MSKKAQFNVQGLHRPIRIALMMAAFPKTSETFIVNKVIGLLEGGMDVVVVCDSSESREWKRFNWVSKSHNLHKRIIKTWPTQPRWLAAFFILPALVWCLTKNFKGSALYLRKGYKQLRWLTLKNFYLDASLIAARPDIIHFEFGALAVHRMHLKSFLNCPITVSFRGYDLNFSGLDQPEFYKEVWDKADGIHCLGEDLWARAKRRGCPTEKFHRLIPPAIDTQVFSRIHFFQPEMAPTESQILRILSVGRLEWKKGYEFALEAVRLLLEKGVHLDYRVVGSGAYLEALAFCRHQLGLENYVHFLGSMDQGAIRQEMSQSDIFLHSAVSEGFCNSVLEAQAMELPVVCTDADGLPENIEDGVTGFAVPRRDPRALAEKIYALAQAPALRKQMGKAGRQRVLEMFCLDTQLRAFEDFYSQVQRLFGWTDSSCR